MKLRLFIFDWLNIVQIGAMIWNVLSSAYSKQNAKHTAHHGTYLEENQARKRQLILLLICPSDNTQETKIAKVSIEENWFSYWLGRCFCLFNGIFLHSAWGEILSKSNELWLLLEVRFQCSFAILPISQLDFDVFWLIKSSLFILRITVQQIGSFF